MGDAAGAARAFTDDAEELIDAAAAPDGARGASQLADRPIDNAIAATQIHRSGTPRRNEATCSSAVAATTSNSVTIVEANIHELFIAAVICQPP
jgi:hypothetical protein